MVELLIPYVKTVGMSTRRKNSDPPPSEIFHGHSVIVSFNGGRDTLPRRRAMRSPEQTALAPLFCALSKKKNKTQTASQATTRQYANTIPARSLLTNRALSV